MLPPPCASPGGDTRVASAPGTSRSRSSGLFKGPAPRGGAAPLFIGTRNPVPSSEFLSQSGACSPGPATLVGGHCCRSLSPLLPRPVQPPPAGLQTSERELVRVALRKRGPRCPLLAGKCGLGVHPLSSVQGPIPPGGGTPRALGLYPHPAFAGLPARGTLLVPGLWSQLWKWLAPSASFVPPLPASAWQTPPASAG